MESQRNEINFLVWAENEEASYELCSEITSGTKEYGFYSKSHKEYDVNAYVRCPNCTTHAAPKNGCVDVLIIALSGASSEHKDAGLEYAGARKGIPFKFIVSKEDLTDLGKPFELNYQSKIDSDFVSKCIKSALDLDITLSSAFKKIDTQGQGFITKEDLINVSKELGHELNNEEANDISTTLSGSEGKINFSSFKKWWLTGRSNFSQFRSLVEMEMKMNDLVKKSSNVFGDYFDKLLKECDGKDTKEGIVSRVNIKPKIDFENGLGLSVEMAIGKEASEILSSLPSYFSSSVITYTLELQVNDAEKGAELVQTLEGLKDMVLQMIPNGQQALEMGVSITFRNISTSVFIDISIGGMLGEMAFSQLNKFNFKNLTISGTSTGYIFSGLRLDDVLDVIVEEAIKRLCQFKVTGHGEFTSFKPLLNLLVEFYSNLLNKPKLKPYLNLVKLFGCLRKFEYETIYDSEELCSIAKDLIGTMVHNKLGQSPIEEVNPEIGMQIAGGVISELQGQGKAILESFKPMIQSVTGMFMGAISSLNFDKIGIHFSAPSFKLYYKIYIHLKGLTKFLTDNIFN